MKKYKVITTVKLAAFERNIILIKKLKKKDFKL